MTGLRQDVSPCFSTSDCYYALPKSRNKVLSSLSSYYNFIWYNTHTHTVEALQELILFLHKV